MYYIVKPQLPMMRNCCPKEITQSPLVATRMAPEGFFFGEMGLLLPTMEKSTTGLLRALKEKIKTVFSFSSGKPIGEAGSFLGFLKKKRFCIS